jgi:hypothetical protein
MSNHTTTAWSLQQVGPDVIGRLSADGQQVEFPTCHFCRRGPVTATKLATKAPRWVGQCTTCGQVHDVEQHEIINGKVTR